ncbi:MAG: PKD domain-containing protein [Bacteroidetes bacterium]|nr:MAG: PKD domain-containing protein [Bacteroidota bacterium]
MRKILSIMLVMLLGVATGNGQTVYKDYVDGKIYVKLRTSYISKTGEAVAPNYNYSVRDLQLDNKLMTAYGIKKVERAFKVNGGEKLNSTLMLEFSNFGAVNDVIAGLEKDPSIEYAEKVPLDKLCLVPNDPRYASQWHLEKINAAVAWNFFGAGSKVVIAIVDDAVERDHPDIAPNLWVNPGEIIGNGIDDDANGYVDDINGWDAALGNNNPNPPNAEFDHGTHVAGISSAATNNGLGVASIGFSCKLMCVKATNSPSAVTAGYAGVLYAANSGANIINMSWGGSGSSVTNQNVVEYAISRGCIMVAAAGNDNVASQFYPAAYPGVVSVASTSTNDTKSSFSNYGPWIKVSAPGSSILSTYYNGTYANLSGTSMASPMVAGLLGLMKSLNPTVPNADLLTCLYSSTDMVQDFGGQMGAGRINAAQAMNCISASLNRAPISDFRGNPLSVVRGNTVTFTDQSSYAPTSWQWSFPGGTPSSFNGQSPPAITYSTVGQYNVTLTVSNAFGGNTSTKTNYITVTDPPTCLTVNFPVPNTWTLLNYLSGSNALNGFVNGVNSNLELQKAMFFNMSATNHTTLTSVAILFGRANGTSPEAVVPIRIYDATGPGNSPGALLGTRNLTMASIRADVLLNRYTIVDFAPSITLPASKTFFVSVDMSNLFWDATFKDTLSIVSNQIGQSTTTDIWQQNASNVWQRYGTAGTWGLTNAALLIHPFLTPNPARSNLNPKNPSVCSGNSFSFDGRGSTFGDILQWQFPGASAPNIINNVIRPSAFYPSGGQYKVYLLTRGGCQEVRVDSTTITVNPSPVINISAPKNPICVGETITLTATGATGLTWSPGTGLNTTTGSIVNANPTNTTTYTISGNLGVCSGSTSFELEVRARTTDVTISTPTVNIDGPRMVTFTAVPFNGGNAAVFKFLVNDVAVQTGASASLTRTVAPGDQIKCEMTSSEACVNEKVVVSNTLTMAAALPVTLVRFTGKKVSADNLLSWTTASEFNSKTFVVERSGNGAANFEYLGSVAAAGNSNAPRNYSYTHQQPLPGKNYYRLKIVDKDGSFEYSNIVLIDDRTGSLTTALYPNPSRMGQQAVLSVSGARAGKLDLLITNAAGQVVLNSSHFSNDGSLRIALPYANLSAGLYTLSITMANGERLNPIKWTVLR